MAVAAIDLGRRRIGLAIAAADGIGAHPLGVIEHRSIAADTAAIAKLLRGREVDTVVVGLPLNMDGSEGPSARSARAFAQRLAVELGVAVELFDERLTSFEAEERLRGMPNRGKSKKMAVDALAAAIILEGWLQARTGKLPPDRNKS